MAEKKLVAILVRHGSTTLNEDNKFRARMDPPLDEKGETQAESAAEAVKNLGEKITKVYSSPLHRAVQTAETVAEYIGASVELTRGLISWDLGFLSGKDRDEFDDILNFYIDNPTLKVPEGESLDDVEQRVFDFFNERLKSGELAVYCTHNSNIVIVENIITGNGDNRPESSETSVDPGGILGVYVDDEGKFSSEVLFGKEKEATFVS
jgi:broad specificity phosphatase PhoE